MGFEFRDDTKTLDINGHTFEILVGDIEALAAGEELAARLKKIDLKATKPGKYRELAASLTAAIDQVLGDGSTAQILDGRRATLTGLVRLLAYVLEESAADLAASVDGLVTDLTETVEEE